MFLSANHAQPRSAPAALEKVKNLSFIFATLSCFLFDKAGYSIVLYLCFLIFFGVTATQMLMTRRIHISPFFNYSVLLKLAFVVNCVCSAFWAIELDQAFSKIVTLILLLGFTLAVFINMSDPILVARLVFYALVISIGINLLIGLGLNPGFSDTYDSWRLQGTRDNPNYLGMEAAVTCLMSLFFLRLDAARGIGYGKIVLYLMMISLSMQVAFFTGSKKGMFICAASLLVAIFFILGEGKSARSILRSASAALISTAMGYVLWSQTADPETVSRVVGRVEEFLGGRGLSTTERLSFISLAFNLWLQSPLFGSGLTNFQALYGVYAHSNLAEILAGMGLVGFVVYYSLFALIGIRLFFLRSKIGLLAFTIFCLWLSFDLAAVTYYSKFSVIVTIFFTCIGVGISQSKG